MRPGSPTRKEWKELVDDHFAKTEKDDALATMDSFYQRAYGMLGVADGPRGVQPEGRDGGDARSCTAWPG